MREDKQGADVGLNVDLTTTPSKSSIEQQTRDNKLLPKLPVGKNEELISMLTKTMDKH